MPALFHLQQVAEKLLKSILISRGIKFEHRHDLQYLLEILNANERLLMHYQDLMDQLTPFAVEIRYPGNLLEVSKAEVISLLQEVTRFREDLLKLIPD